MPLGEKYYTLWLGKHNLYKQIPTFQYLGTRHEQHWTAQYHPFYDSRHPRGSSRRVTLAQRSVTRTVGRGKRRSQNKKWWIATCQKPLPGGNEQELHMPSRGKSLSLPLLAHIIFTNKNQSSHFHSWIGQHGDPQEDECAGWTNSTLPLKHNDDCCQCLQSNTQKRYTCMHVHILV